jgi:hypothetical protein
MIKIGETVGNKQTNEIFARKGKIISIKTSHEVYQTGSVSATVNAYGGIHIYDSRQIHQDKTRHLLIRFEDTQEERTIFLTNYNILMTVGNSISVCSIKGKKDLLYPHVVINHNTGAHDFLPININLLTSTKDSHLPFAIVNAVLSYVGSSYIFPSAKLLEIPFITSFIFMFFILFFIANFIKKSISVDIKYNEAIGDIIRNYKKLYHTPNLNIIPLCVKLNIINITGNLGKKILKFSKYFLYFSTASFILFFIIGFFDYVINSDSISQSSKILIKERKLKQGVSLPENMHKYLLAASESESNLISSRPQIVDDIEYNRQGLPKNFNEISSYNPFFEFLYMSKIFGSSLASQFIIDENDNLLLITGGKRRIKGKNTYQKLSNKYFKKNISELSPDEFLFAYELIANSGYEAGWSIDEFTEGLKSVDSIVETQVCFKYFYYREEYFDYLGLTPDNNSEVYKNCILETKDRGYLNYL